MGYQFNIVALLENSLIKKEYVILFLFLLFTIVLTVLIIGASYSFAKQNPDSEKLSSYECGFEPYEDTRHTFDIKFCVIAILFSESLLLCCLSLLVKNFY